MDALILTGGESRRMGKDKKDLLFENKTFLNRIKESLAPLGRIYISTRDGEGEGIISDIYKDCGPLGGIHAGLRKLDSQEIFVLACDMPLIQWSHVKDLIDRYYEKKKPAIFVPKTTRVHPLCGIYSKEILKDLEDCLEKRDLRLQKFLSSQLTFYFQVNDPSFIRALEANINTPDAYERLLGGQDESR